MSNRPNRSNFWTAKSALIRKIATAAFAITVVVLSTGTVNANEILNGNFTQAVPNKNPTFFPANGQQQSGPSAAKDWTQVKVVPDSYFWTRVESGAGPQHTLHVKTNGGIWKPDSQGNGVWQSFAKPAKRFALLPHKSA